MHPPRTSVNHLLWQSALAVAAAWLGRSPAAVSQSSVSVHSADWVVLFPAGTAELRSWAAHRLDYWRKDLLVYRKPLSADLTSVAQRMVASAVPLLRPALSLYSEEWELFQPAAVAPSAARPYSENWQAFPARP